MSKHTKGPWVANACPDGFYIGNRTENVAIVHGYTDHPGNIANATLIAAAPDLLEALKDVRFMLYGEGPGNPKVDAAIARAEGRDV